MRRRGTQNKTETKKLDRLGKKRESKYGKSRASKEEERGKKLCWKPAITPCPWDEREKK